MSEPRMIYITERHLSELCEHIAIAAANARDPNGLHSWSRGNIEALPKVALTALLEWTGDLWKVLPE